MIIEDAVIRLPSLFKPNEAIIIEGQSYKGCVIAGPANIIFDGHLTATGNLHLENCDCVVLKAGLISLNTAVMFRNCSFIDCRFERVCLLLSPDIAGPMAARHGDRINWLTDPPEIPATLPAQPVEGMTKQ